MTDLSVSLSFFTGGKSEMLFFAPPPLLLELSEKNIQDADGRFLFFGILTVV